MSVHEPRAASGILVHFKTGPCEEHSNCTNTEPHTACPTTCLCDFFSLLTHIFLFWKRGKMSATLKMLLVWVRSQLIRNDWVAIMFLTSLFFAFVCQVVDGWPLPCEVQGRAVV